MKRKIQICGELDSVYSYPTHVCVPLAKGEVIGENSCGLLADGVKILSQAETVMHWPDGSAKWQHVHANLRAGVAYEYHTDHTNPVSSLRVIEDPAQIEVDNGQIKVIVDKGPTAGLVEICDSNTEQLYASQSHFMVDERGIRFSVQDDLEAIVEIEFAGPQVVCIKISGWYESKEKRVPPFVLCCTRIYIFADSPLVKYDHGATFADNMNLHGILQMGLEFYGADSIKLVGRELEKKFPQSIVGTTFWQWSGLSHIEEQSDTWPAHLYKNLWLHNGPMLDPRLPNAYFSAWKQQTDTTECKAEYARAGNMQGIMMHSQFGVLVNTEMPSRLYENNAIGIVEPKEACRTGVMGSISESGTFADVDEWVNRAALGNEKAIERYGDHGLFNYGNLHHNELMSQDRPSLHRIWSNGHYQQNSLWWKLFFRSGNYDLLHFARISSDYYASIGTIRYDALAGKPDGSPGPETKFHLPGANYHVKGCLPWGGRDYGMDSNDIDADLIGHWPDPTSNLYAWLIDADANARDAYELWADNVKFRSEGWARETNTSIVHAIYLYDYMERQDPALLANIQGMRTGLMTYPLKDQAPGPIWHPEWLSVYYEAFPEDTEFKTWMLAQAPSVMPGIEGVWAMALAATYFDATGDIKYLRVQQSTIDRAVKVLFESHDKWNDYGSKPGPGNDQHFLFQWPRLAAAYKKAGVELGGNYEPGNCLFGIARLSTDWPEDMEIRGTHIYALVPEGTESFDITVDGQTLGAGDMQACSMYVNDPNGLQVLNVPRLPMTNGVRNRVWRASNWEVDREVYTIQTNGVSGLWEIVFGSDGIGLYQKLTQYPEAQLLQSLNGPMHLSGEQIRYKIKHGIVYLQKTSDNGETGFIRFKAKGERCGTCVNGTWIKYGQTVSLADPTKLEVFSDGDGWAEIEIDYDTRYPFWAASSEDDLLQIATNQIA